MIEYQNTSNLELPYIMASQAQKHVTHNETFKKLDAIVQLAVISQTSIPETENLTEGSRFIVPDDADGPFVGMDGTDWDTVIDIDNTSKNIGLNGETASTNFGLSVGSGLSVNARNHPLYNLIQADNSFQNTSMDCYSSAQTWHGNRFIARRERGSAANPESVQNGDLIYLFGISAHNGESFQRTVQERYFVDGKVNGTSIPVGYNLAFADSAGIYRSRLRIQPNGNIGLGVYFPTTKLHVDGPVRVKSYSHTNLPPASGHEVGSMIFVPDLSEGPCMAFSDGHAWRRMDTSSVT